MERVARKLQGATYAIGDIQGCFEPLGRLLERIRFGPHDRAWLVGDLVNRGPRSLDVLRWAKGLGQRATVVLGNHDLRLLACAVGARRPRKRDTFQGVLRAADAEELIDWLSHRPLLHREGKRVMVHAGLHPAWTLDEATALAEELARALRKKPGATLHTLESVQPSPEWKESLRGDERLATIAAVLTRARTCTVDGRMCFDYDGPPHRAPANCRPWFAIPWRRTREAAIVFGHWAALGFHRSPGVLALDSGCARGQALTAVRLDDGQVFQEPAHAWTASKPT
jgi:bis(5'-nucleosyl)-tetraphosphatase (symmetrical)